MKKTMLTLFAVIFSSVALWAPNPKADSLINALNERKLTPAQLLSVYKDLCDIYSENEVDKCTFYARKGLELAKKTDDKLRMSQFVGQIGVNCYTKSVYDSALLYLEQAGEWAVESRDKTQEAVVNMDMGNAYRRQTEYDKALEKYMAAMAIYDEIDDRRGYAIALINIGGMHETLKNYERAFVYLEQAAEISRKTDSKNVEMNVAYRLGRLYARAWRNAEAIEHTLKAYEISRAIYDKKFEIATLTLLVTTYANMGDFDQSIEYGNQCAQLAEEYGDRRMLMGVLSEFSDTYRKQGLYKECADMALKAWRMDTTDVVYATDAAFSLSLAHIHLGDKDKAAYYLDHFGNLIMRRTEKNSHDALYEMEVKYETEKKETHIAALEKDKKLYTSLGASVVLALLSVIGLLFYRHRLSAQKRKLAEQQIKQLEQEKELIATRSALDAEKAEREIIARDLHDGVGAMLSVVKNNMNIMKSYSVIENKEAEHFDKALDGLDKSIAELRRVAHHIMPAILMEKGLPASLDDFCRSIPEAVFHCSESDRRFDPEKELVLYRCAYELVNNALRHAQASRIEVHLNMDEETIYLSVVDNGCGFDSQTVSPVRGIKNMRARLAVFGGRLDIYSEPGNGTEASVELMMRKD